MKSYSWTVGGLSVGLKVQTDEKLGQIVFLGEEGRGRRYEKVSLSRRNPADIENGCVINADPIKITLSAKEGKPEKSFYVLERSVKATRNVLMRINSYGGYIRGGHGQWSDVAGKPELLVSGYGAFGDAGRIGNWDDGLVVMHPGDVIRIHLSRTWGYGDSALWIDEAGVPKTVSWQDYETMMAIHEAEAIIADAEQKSQGLEIIAGQMQCFSFRGGEIVSGIKLDKGSLGAAIRLGEEGRGRKIVEIPVVKFEAEEAVNWAAVANIGNGMFGLVKSQKAEPNSCLVRICTRQGYTRRGNGSWKLWKGNPILVTKGSGADGDAGRIGNWDDGLFILHEGDVIFVRPSGDGPDYALFVKNSKVEVEDWLKWKIRDAERDPDFYVAKGTAPWGHVPSKWIGQIVTTIEMGGYAMSGGDIIPCFQERETGELISVEPFVLNLGWDGCDRHDVTFHSALWVSLTDKKARRLEGDEADKRKLVRNEAEMLRNKAITMSAQSYFGLVETNLRSDVQKLIANESLDTMPTEGWSSLTSWVKEAKDVLEKFTRIEEELKTLEQRQSTGEILVDFGGHFRVMGATGNAQYWVIKPDGSEREPDEVSFRKQYTSEGEKKWRLIGPGELAISWFKAYTAANHGFTINKLPQGGCTPEQLATINRLELEISSCWEGARGFSGKVSPSIGDGWGLSPQKK